ncbi:ankyrin repeat domain-containing protein 30A [Trachypithecus francoisi]|uniref:ankyrin repeat domain-containing protein 30A n=1 Tax=Trachypithecus francoisi TaxID=54180 RepID=UPI00141B3CC6|nr:ankyrin repeat domain-containing protein 30A [Trachypithecus francoisi]
MQWIPPFGVLDLPTVPERPSPFSELVYTNNDSYIIHYGDLRKIHKAASQGRVLKLEKITAKKKTINLNVKDSKKRTALHWACVNGHAEVVTFLVDRKCRLDVLDGEDRTPLMKALQCQREDCANILVDSGAGLNIVDVYGNTALHYAVYNKNLSAVAKLVSHGAVVEMQNKAYLTPLLLAITKRSEQIVEFLLTKNANANAVSRFKRTALMLAVCHGSSEIVGMLLLRNVDVFAEDTCGMTAEHYAIACGFDHIHQQLLEYIRKLSKNTSPEGTSAGTPDKTAPLVEGTPDTAEGLVEKSPDEAAPLVEGTPDTAESLVEKSPDEAAPLVEGTPDTAESLVEKSPDEAAPLVEGTPDTAESLVEKSPDEAAPLVEGTPDKIQCLGKATSGKFEQLAEETPRKITRPAKETSGYNICPVTGRLTKIAWEKKARRVKTERVAVVTSNKTQVSEKGTSKMTACPTKETSTKASTNVHVSPAESIFSLFGKPPIENSQSTKLEKDFNRATKIISKSAEQNYMCLPGAAIYENDVKTINHKIEDQMIRSESKQKDEEENSWDLEGVRETVSQKDVCLPKATPPKEFHTISGKLEDQMIPSESKQKDEEENSWDLEGVRETVSQKDVCLPKATPPKEFHTISGKLEDQMIPSESKQKDEEENSWDLESDRETVSQKDVCFPKATPQKEFHTISGKLEDQMIPSESKQKDGEENSWDLEGVRETVSQKDVCLPKATPPKEFHTISGKLEESPHKDGLLKPTCGMKVSIPNKALEMKDIQTFKAVDVSSIESIFSPFGKPTTENSQPTKLEEDFNLATKEEATKTVTGQQEDDIGIIEQAPQDQTNKIPTSESGQKEGTKSSSDSEIISVSDTQNYVCLPEATYQKEIKTINGKIEESTEKPSDFEPAIEMQNSVPNKALEWRNKQTLRADNMLTLKSGKETYAESRWSSKNFEQSISESAAQNYTCLPEATYQEEVKNINGKLKDSTSLSKSLDAVPSCKRARELKKDHCEQLTGKIEGMKNKLCVLKKELSEAKEIKSQLENQKVKWEQELCSVRLTLNQEEEKRRNANMLNEKIRKKLGRIKEQHRKELEVKQELEQALRIQDMELKSVRSNLSQVSHTQENENALLHENCMLKKEIAMLKLEIAKLKHQHQEKENKYFKDIKILKEKNAELQMTLKLKEKTLTKRASQYSGQLKVLMAENTMLTSKLKEKQDKEILEREIESYHPRLASAVQDRDQIVTSRKSQGLAFHMAGDACLQDKINVDVNNTIYNNEVLHQPLSEAQRKSKSVKINLNYARDALRENTLVSEHAQRERDETQYQMKKAEHMYQNEQDNVNIHNEEQESLEQKLFQLQSKNMWLRQQLVHAHKKADNKSKITINTQLLKRKMQHHLLKKKNEEVFNYSNHLKDRIYKYEKEKEEREERQAETSKKLLLEKQQTRSLFTTHARRPVLELPCVGNLTDSLSRQNTYFRRKIHDFFLKPTT